MVAANNSINNTVGTSLSGITNTLTVTNGSNSASSGAQALITVGGTTAASPWLQWTIGTTESWVLGQNNSGTQKLYMNYTNSATLNPTTGTNMFIFDHVAPGMVYAAGQSVIYNTTASAVGSLATNGYNIYETGTYTPTLVGTSVTGTTTYSSQVGQYVRFQQKVNVNFAIVITGMSGTGDALFGALPFIIKNDTPTREGQARLSSTSWAFSSTRTMVAYVTINNSTTFNLNASGDGLVSNNVTCTNNSATFNGTMTYSI